MEAIYFTRHLFAFAYGKNFGNAVSEGTAETRLLSGGNHKFSMYLVDYDLFYLLLLLAV